MLPLEVFPLAGADNQLPPLVVATAMLNGMELPLLALTVRPCGAGSEPVPTMLKVRALDDTCRVGSATTTNVAGMVNGLLVAPAEGTGIRAADEAEVVALPGETASQAPPVVVAATAV